MYLNTLKLTGESFILRSSLDFHTLQLFRAVTRVSIVINWRVEITYLKIKFYITMTILKKSYLTF